jgi:hypothetical protein
VAVGWRRTLPQARYSCSASSTPRTTLAGALATATLVPRAKSNAPGGLCRLATLVVPLWFTRAPFMLAHCQGRSRTSHSQFPGAALACFVGVQLGEIHITTFGNPATSRRGPWLCAPASQRVCLFQDGGIIPGHNAFSSICNDPEDPNSCLEAHPHVSTLPFLHYLVKTNLDHWGALPSSENRHHQGRDPGPGPREIQVGSTRPAAF